MIRRAFLARSPDTAPVFRASGEAVIRAARCREPPGFFLDSVRSVTDAAFVIRIFLFSAGLLLGCGDEIEDGRADDGDSENPKKFHRASVLLFAKVEALCVSL